MTIDTFYNDISEELKHLPPNASVGQQIGAVLKGIGESFIDLFEEFTLTGQIIGAIEKSHKLDKQYNKDRSFLKKLSDYHNYFTVVKEEGSGASEINFAGGSESWNGGDITFHLGKSGQSTLTLETTGLDGRLLKETHTVDTVGVNDIIMGIGESHSISFKKQTAKFLWFIPVHSKTLISDSSGEKETLHGSYYGNSKDNKFIAVQYLPPKSNSLGYNLHDYHYKLYGRGGDDAFYLGPQHSYVEGNDGSDTYFVNSSSVYTEINNFANDRKMDHLIINLDYAHLTPRRVGLSLRITTADGSHIILIDNWFHDDSYQHMVFKTQDGVVFKVSATGTGQVEFLPYALSGDMFTHHYQQVLDARGSEFSQVVTLIGSKNRNELYGNKMDNQLDAGAGGNNKLTGGEGKDTYTINFSEYTSAEIDNYANDGKTDVLLFGAKFDDIISGSYPDTNDLTLLHMKNGSLYGGVIVKKWFLSHKYRHMILISEDGVVLNISSSRDSFYESEFVKLQPIMVDMSLIRGIEASALSQTFSAASAADFQGNLVQPYNVCTTPQRAIDLSKDPLLTEVVTLLGSEQNDLMVGNHQDNYMSGGKGCDIMEGKEGQDVYVVKQGDGSNTIKNFARDDSVDTLLFDANFEDIEVGTSFRDLVLTAHESTPKKKIEVIIENWFLGEEAFQHMVVRSIDGVVFELPVNEHSLVKTPKALDYSKLSTDIHITLTGKWSQVQRVIGSKGENTMVGNSLSNYLDPGLGRCYLQGNNGSDTYVIRNYKMGNVINNHADDEVPDTVLFMVPFFSVNVKISGGDIQLISITSKGHVDVTLEGYASKPENRHLTVITEDGYTFVLPTYNNYKPVPIIINRVQRTVGQHINLTANSSFSEIRTVYGSKGFQNFIVGNQLNNSIVGGSEADFLQGLGGDDVLKGGAGGDTLVGGPGADTLLGGEGNDRLEGGEGDDVISPGHGNNQVYGGEGSDTVIYSGEVLAEKGIHLNLKQKRCIHEGNAEDTLYSIENAYGTDFSDRLEGDDKSNVLVGQGGDDYLAPGSGYDILNGGNGKDTYDLTAADGTVTLHNYATDGALDGVLIDANADHLRYEKAGSDLVVRVVNVQYPVFFEGTKPTVIFKSWFVDSKLYGHAYIDTADGRIEPNFLEDNAGLAAARAAA